MGAVYVDPVISEEERRQLLYGGEMFVLSPGESSAALARLARDLSEEAFAPHEPQTAQERMPAERYVEILADLKPRFIHHPRAKELIKGLLAESGADVDKTYFDVPRLRTMAHGEYLKAGLAHQFHAHRDTWFSAPMAQLNWWLPVYAIESDNSMAFHPRYFDEPIKNSSAGLRLRDLERTGRQQAAKHVEKETRKQPTAEEPLELEPYVRVVTPPSAARSSSPPRNFTRPSRTPPTGRASASTSGRSTSTTSRTAPPPRTSTLTAPGTTLRDFLRASDLEPLPEEIIAMYDVAREAAAV